MQLLRAADALTNVVGGEADHEVRTASIGRAVRAGLALALLSALIALVAGCGNQDATVADGAGFLASVAGTSTSARDVALVQEVLRERQQNVDLAELILQRSTTVALVSMAGALQDDNDRELDALQDQLVRWGADATGQDHAGHTDLPVLVDGDAPDGAEPMAAACVLPTNRLDAIHAATGGDFDRLVVAALVDHALSTMAALRQWATPHASPLGAEARVVRARADLDADRLLSAASTLQRSLSG